MISSATPSPTTPPPMMITLERVSVIQKMDSMDGTASLSLDSVSFSARTAQSRRRLIIRGIDISLLSWLFD